MRQVFFLVFLLTAFSAKGNIAAIEAKAIDSDKCRSRFNHTDAKPKPKKNLPGECSECGYSRINREAKKNVEALLKRPLTEKEAQALVSSHYAPQFLPKALAYLKELEKKWILKRAGFSEDEIEAILYFDFSNEIQSALDAPQTNLRQNILSGTVPEKENNQVQIIGGINALVGRISQSVPTDEPQKKAVLLEFPDVKTGKINQIKQDINSILFDEKETEHYTGAGGVVHIYSGAPEISKVFAAYRSERKILSMKELNLPENALLEYGMKGIAPKYARGWPEIQEQIAFGKAVRSLKSPPHPLKTHIEYFALKIPLHINYISKGIDRSKTLNPKQKRTAHQLLNELKEMARRAVQEKAVTYSWWLIFNENLAIVISGYKELSETVGNSLFYTRILSVFPVFLSLPIIKGELGTAALSRAFANRIFPIGLVTKPTKVDRQLLDSWQFADHDMDHAYDAALHFISHSYLGKGQVLNTNTHVKFMETLSGEERKQAEDQYFEYTHEIF